MPDNLLRVNWFFGYWWFWFNQDRTRGACMSK